jgi:hypothetical protein
MLVIPAFYRDVLDESSGTKSGDLNSLYIKLLRSTDMLSNSLMFDFAFYSTDYTIQQTLVDIYDYFKLKLQKKNGMIRKSLMGKTIDYSVRTVITAPSYQADRLEDMPINFTHTQVPLTQVLDLCYPYIIRELKLWFERIVFSKVDSGIPVMTRDGNGETISKLMYPIDPESTFTDQYFDKVLDSYIKNPASRFNKVQFKSKDSNGKIRDNTSLYLTGKRGYKDSDHQGADYIKEITWTDLLYIIACDVVENKYVMLTRYPDMGTFFNKITVVSTIKHEKFTLNGKVYPMFPVVDQNISHDDMSGIFIDTVSFSNSYCSDMVADYDGDQITIKIIWSQEANAEAEKFLYSKQNILDSTASRNKRTIESEAAQTIYVLTKDPRKDAKTVPPVVVKQILDTPLDQMDYKFFSDLFGDKFINGKEVKSKYNTYDKVKLNKSMYKYVDGEIETTIGRLLYNRYLLERTGLYSVIPYVNRPVVNKLQGKMQDEICAALLDDKVKTEQMMQYIDARDYLGLKLNALLTTSYSTIMMRTPDKVKKRREELLEKNKEKLEKGDINTVVAIENELLEIAEKEIADDPAMDLFKSGARGSFGNNYKCNNIMRGAVPNNITGKYDIITSSYLDGFDKKDIPALNNSALAGAYTKAVGTSESGYLQKELVQMMQTDRTAEKGTDCHSKHPIDILLTKDNISGFVYRYIVEGDKIVELTHENIGKYVDKHVKMRTPLSCTSSNGICNVCAGNLSYKMGVRNVGLTISCLGQTLTNLNMKGFHDSTIKLGNINFDESLISV